MKERFKSYFKNIVRYMLFYFIFCALILFYFRSFISRDSFSSFLNDEIEHFFRETALETSISKISLHGFSRLKFKDVRVRDKLENINLIDIEKAWFNPSVNFLGYYTFKLLLKKV